MHLYTLDAASNFHRAFHKQEFHNHHLEYRIGRTINRQTRVVLPRFYHLITRHFLLNSLKLPLRAPPTWVDHPALRGAELVLYVDIL